MMNESSKLQITKPIYVNWNDFKIGKKYKIWNMLEKIGDELIVVMTHPMSKQGLSLSLNEYNEISGKNIVILYTSKHLVRVKFKGMY